jgi:type II secretory pathway pseudopilin PulG
VFMTLKVVPLENHVQGKIMLSGDGVTKCKNKSYGFAYIFILVTIAVLSVIAANSLQVGTQITRRNAEEALQVVGLEFEQALYSYANATPINNPNSIAGAKGPRTLAELLKDTRFVDVKRHLRQLYSDPLSGRDEWGVVTDSAGFILGVYSLAYGKPIKQTGFASFHSNFEEASSYDRWIFGLPTAYYSGNLSTTSNVIVEKK